MGGGLAAETIEVVIERLAVTRRGSIGRVAVNFEMFIVLNMIATRIKWMRAIRRTHDRVGRRDRRLPRIGSNLLIRDDLIDLHDHAVRGAAHEEIDPSGTAD